MNRVKLNLPLSPEHRLIRWANAMRGFYGHPVYLVGSQITGKDKPSDVDVICVIPDDEFELRYGSLGEWMQEGGTGIYTDIRWCYYDDCLKRSLDGMRSTLMVIDFKVQSKTQFRGFEGLHVAFPPLRLDTRPD